MFTNTEGLGPKKACVPRSEPLIISETGMNPTSQSTIGRYEAVKLPDCGIEDEEVFVPCVQYLEIRN